MRCRTGVSCVGAGQEQLGFLSVVALLSLRHVRISGNRQPCPGVTRWPSSLFSGGFGFAAGVLVGAAIVGGPWKQT